jgi:hypothetical protein
MVLLLYLCFPILCILAVRSLVFGLALYQTLILAIGLFLGTAHYLTVEAYIAALVCASVPLFFLACHNRPRFSLSPRFLKTRRGVTAFILACIVAVAYLAQVGFDAVYGTRHGDGLWYHIPRVIFWLQNQSFEAWPTPVPAQIGLPVGADLILLHKVLLGLGWNGAGYVTLVLSVGAITCVYLAARDFRLSKWSAAMTALLFASFPVIGLRIWAINSDIAAAFPVFAAYLALQRIREARVAVAVFILLNGVALACKPTIALLAFPLGCVALWQCRQKIILGVLPGAAAITGALFVFASYWPVYLAFGDFLGGEYNSSHRTSTVAEFANAAAIHTGQWLLEPLTYISPFLDLNGLALTLYNWCGASFETLPPMWTLYVSGDTGRTGMALMLAIPFLLVGFSHRTKAIIVILLLAVYLPLSGMILPQPFVSRYLVVLWAGVALLWGASDLFRGRRWLLTGVIAVNACVLLMVVAMNIHVDRTNWSKGMYSYLTADDREYIAQSLTGPLLVIAQESMDALLVGPEIRFPFEYVTCPADGDWTRELQRGQWLALIHNGTESLRTGLEWERPGLHSCPSTPVLELENSLVNAGWSSYKKGNIVDLWVRPERARVHTRLGQGW